MTGNNNIWLLSESQVDFDTKIFSFLSGPSNDGHNNRWLVSDWFFDNQMEKNLFPLSPSHTAQQSIGERWWVVVVALWVVIPSCRRRLVFSCVYISRLFSDDVERKSTFSFFFLSTRFFFPQKKKTMRSDSRCAQVKDESSYFIMAFELKVEKKNSAFPLAHKKSLAGSRRKEINKLCANCSDFFFQLLKIRIKKNN